jgi:hypothetical protein
MANLRGLIGWSWRDDAGDILSGILEPRFAGARNGRW